MVAFGSTVLGMGMSYEDVDSWLGVFTQFEPCVSLSGPRASISAGGDIVLADINGDVTATGGFTDQFDGILGTFVGVV